MKNDDFEWPTLPPAGRVSGEHATSHASTPLLEMYTMVYTPDETPLRGLPDQIRGCRFGSADRGARFGEFLVLQKRRVFFFCGNFRGISLDINYKIL